VCAKRTSISMRAWRSIRYLSEDADWDSDPLRMLHACFLRRSSKDGDQPAMRLGLPETGAWRRGPRGLFHRLRRRRTRDPRIKEYVRRGSSWKEEWYARGELVNVDASAFLEPEKVAGPPDGRHAAGRADWGLPST